MAIRMTKEWTPLTAETVDRLPGQLGVYQLANTEGQIVYIGYAGGRTLFGLRSALEGVLAAQPHGADRFRVEINQQYITRWEELLMVHVADHGALPPGNTDHHPRRMGRLSPL
jgi:hypothetical protein